MQIFVDALRDALQLLVSPSADLRAIVGLTLRVTGSALLIAVLVGTPIGVALGLTRRRRLTGCVVPLLYTTMGLPPVVVGLVVFIALSNQGPLGDLDRLFTPTAMIFAQTIIALPLMIGLTLTAIQSLEPALPLQLRALGATRLQVAGTLVAEARVGIVAATVTALGSIISEVGAVILVGGNIAGETRVLTTAIVLETRRGNFALALALGIILLGIAFAGNWVLFRLQPRP